MATSEEVLLAIDGLRQAEGPLNRAQAVGDLWRKIRAASSAERKDLALSLAQRYAPDLVDKVADGNDVNQVQMLNLVRDLGRLDVEEIEAFMSSLRDGEERQRLAEAALTAGLSALDEAELVEGLDPGLVELATDVGEVALANVINAIDNLDVDEGDVPEPASKQPAGPMDALSLGSWAAPDPETNNAAEPPYEIAAPLSAEVLEPPEIDAEQSSTSRREPLSDIASPSEPPPEDARRDPAPEPLQARPDRHETREPERVDITSVQHIIDAHTPLLRLRLLNESPDIPWLRDQDVLVLIAAFPPGWQRRRAAVAILRRRRSSGLQSAAAVIGLLERPMSRRWAASTVLDTWDLEVEEARAFLETVGVTSLQHRIVAEE